MGSQLYRVSSIRIIMKFLVLASLLALAAAEADPQIPRYPSWYTGYTGYTGYTQPWTYRQSMVYQYPTVYGGYHHLAKRDAEAEAEADPYVFYQTHGYYPSWYTGYAGY